MKNIAIIIIVFLSVFSSCTTDNKERATTADYYGKWTLVKMSGSVPNSEATGEAMEWQEFYIFKANGTFTKIRIRNKINTKISGKYSIEKYQDGMYLELTYQNDSNIIGGCSGNLKEELHFSANNTVLSSTWRNCDGPGLDYKKIMVY